MHLFGGSRLYDDCTIPTPFLIIFLDFLVNNCRKQVDEGRKVAVLIKLLRKWYHPQCFPISPLKQRHSSPRTLCNSPASRLSHKRRRRVRNAAIPHSVCPFLVAFPHVFPFFFTRNLPSSPVHAKWSLAGPITVLLLSARTTQPARASCTQSLSSTHSHTHT